MLSYKQWKMLNESFAGPLTLGIGRPAGLGLVSDRPMYGYEPVSEGKKKSKKHMDDEDDGMKIVIGGDDEDASEDDIEDTLDDSPCGAKCGKAKSKKKSKKQAEKKSRKKSRKYMGSDTSDIASVLGGGGKPKRPRIGDDLGTEEDVEDEDLEGGDEDLEGLGDDEDLEGGDEDLEGGDEDLEGEEDLGDLDSLDGDSEGAMPMPKKKGKPLFMRKKMKKKMRKEHTSPEEMQWWQSVRNMLGTTGQKYNDGWSEYQEDALIPPDDPNARVTQDEPGPGEVGFAPQTRFGLQGQGQYEESSRRGRKSR